MINWNFLGLESSKRETNINISRKKTIQSVFILSHSPQINISSSNHSGDETISIISTDHFTQYIPIVFSDSIELMSNLNVKLLPVCMDYLYAKNYAKLYTFLFSIQFFNNAMK